MDIDLVGTREQGREQPDGAGAHHQKPLTRLDVCRLCGAPRIPARLHERAHGVIHGLWKLAQAALRDGYLFSQSARPSSADAELLEVLAHPMPPVATPTARFIADHR